MGDLGYFLRLEDSGELHRILMLGVSGAFEFTQDEMVFTVHKLADRVYGSGRGPLLGKEAVWVGTTDKDAQTTTISWKALEGGADTQDKCAPSLVIDLVLRVCRILRCRPTGSRRHWPTV